MKLAADHVAARAVQGAAEVCAADAQAVGSARLRQGDHPRSDERSTRPGSFSRLLFVAI